ncbi:MAG: autotransporter outer membrane beta-barrel domain-containing protein [Alphaproteobacteria bacterium]
MLTTVDTDVTALIFAAGEVLTLSFTGGNVGTASLRAGGGPLGGTTSTPPAGFSYTITTEDAAAAFQLRVRIFNNNAAAETYNWRLTCTGLGGTTTTPSNASSTHKVVDATQSRLNTQNIQRHMQTLTAGNLNGGTGGGGTGGTGGTGGNFAGDTASRLIGAFAPRSTPAGGAGAGLGFGRAQEEAEDDPFRRAQRRTVGGRDGLREGVAMVSFDTAAGDQLAQAGRNEPNAPTEQRRTLAPQDPRGSVWAYGAWSDVRNSRNLVNDDQRFSGDVIAVTGGGDYQVVDNVWVGLAATWMTTSLSTTFNNGSYDEETWTLAPYAVWRISDILSADITLGGARGSIEQTRNRTTRQVDANTEATSMFGAAGLTARIRPGDGPWLLTGRTSYLRSRKLIDSFTESDGTFVDDDEANTSQLRGGGDVAYEIAVEGTRLVPHIGVEYVHDIMDEVNGDASAQVVQGGLRFFVDPVGLYGIVDVSSELGRDDFQDHTLRVMLVQRLALPGSGTAANPFVQTITQAGRRELAGGLQVTGGELPFDTTLRAATIDRQRGPGEQRLTLSLSGAF